MTSRTQLFVGRVVVAAAALWLLTRSLRHLASGPWVAIEAAGPLGATAAAAVALALAAAMPRRRTLVLVATPLLGSLVFSPLALALIIGEVPPRLAGRVGGSGLGYATLYAALFAAIFMRRDHRPGGAPGVRGVVLAALAFGSGGTGVAGQSPAQLVGDAFVAVRVQDVEAASSWYIGVFDLVEVNRVEAADYSIRILTGPGLSVELIQQSGDVEPAGRPFGLFKSGIFVRDIDAFYREMQRRGVSTDHEVFVDRALQMRSFVMRDPEGNRLQVFQRCAADCT
jgi:catechol 2,3-dioxygenase-like lactoylglutathione lyase family enzyme